MSGDANANGEDAGSVAVFERTSEGWTRDGTLVAEDGDARDSFGAAVALSTDGTTALVGASADEDPNGEGAGSAYVFKRRDSWREEAKLAGEAESNLAAFGERVALTANGETAVVGAWRYTGSNGVGAGAAYVFERGDDGWSEATKIVASDASSGDGFGYDVAIADDGLTVVVSAEGSAYVFEPADSGWTQRTKIPGDGAPDGTFGKSVALSADGTVVLVGARDVAFTFERANEKWVRTVVTPTADEIGDYFGRAVALSADGSSALVGASGDEDPNGKRSGSASVFSLP